MVIIDVNNTITEYNTHWMGSSADIRIENYRSDFGISDATRAQEHNIKPEAFLHYV